MSEECYVVKMGRRPGIYYSWAEVLEQTKGFVGASFKKCRNVEEAKIVLGIKDLSDVTSLAEHQTVFLSQKKGILNIYTDGSFCRDNHIVSNAFLIVEEGQVTYEEVDAEVNIEISKELDSAAGELKAAMKALLYASKTGRKHIVIYHDNQQVGALYYGEMKARKPLQKKYVEYIHKLISQSGMVVNFTKVKAHKGNVYNARVDQLAKQAMLRIRMERGLHITQEEERIVASVIHSVYYDYCDKRQLAKLSKKHIRKLANQIASGKFMRKKGVSEAYVIDYIQKQSKELQKKQAKRRKKALAQKGVEHISDR